MAGCLGTPDASPVRIDRVDPGAGDRKRQRAFALLRHELREQRESAPIAVGSGGGSRRWWRPHGAIAAGHRPPASESQTVALKQQVHADRGIIARNCYFTPDLVGYPPMR